MSEKHPHPPTAELEREFELERMILFSDAIFAIAITLMVIDIKWPEIPENLKGVDIGQLLHPTVVQFAIFPFTASGFVGHIRNGFVYPFLFYVFNLVAVGFCDFLIARYIFKVKPGLSIQGNADYLEYAFCAYPIGIRISNNKLRKFKPKTTTS